MAMLDELKQAVSDAIKTGASEARAQGTALKGDFENLVKPQLNDILVQVESITKDYVAGNISKAQAQSDLTTQRDRIKPIILTVAELAFLAVQTIINAALDALKTVVNKAAGVALL